jgi:hypothetical protein
MMAMLAGSKLAAHTLQLTVGSTSTLSQLFPAVPHIARFNLRSDAARAFLENADYHIASVSIPYALATHEDFVVEMLKFLKGNGVALQTGGRNIRAWLESFHVLREVRNCITHAGGSADSKLSEAIAAMGTGARAGWAAVNNGLAPESLIVGGRVALTAELIFQAFAITKRLGREINAALQSKLASAVWARMLVEDFAAQTSKAKNSDQWRRSLTGYASKHYSGMPIDAEELESAARELGVWTSARWPS